MGGTRTADNDPSYQAFVTWVASKTDADFKQMVSRGNLSRIDIAKECNFAKSVLLQNPRVKRHLADLEADLRARGILPSTAEKKSDGDLPMRETGKGKTVMNEARLRELETQNAFLLAENKELKKKLARYVTALVETGRIPR